MTEYLWKKIAAFLSWQPIATRLILRAVWNPYLHIVKGGRLVYAAPGQVFEHPDLYMGRYWLFNPYDPEQDDNDRVWWRRLLPSIRLHHIRQPDADPHLHDHPRHSRTIILTGGYIEETLEGERFLCKGDTSILTRDKFHRINRIVGDNVWTMFITWGYIGWWGYLVDGKKVCWRDYPYGNFQDEELSKNE